jgi:dipicolinate synthase subunit B
MTLDHVKVGLAITGSFCTLDNFYKHIGKLAKASGSVTPIFSETAYGLDTRFGEAAARVADIEKLTGTAAISTIAEAERIGPGRFFDVLVVAPCTGNTLAKLACGITDTAVTMAVKAHLRNNRPVVLGISSNDILGANARNLGVLLNTKHFYFVPFYQDDPENKTKSVSFDMDQLFAAVEKALDGEQLQPVLTVKKTRRPTSPRKKP